MARSRVLWLGWWVLVLPGCGWERPIRGSGVIETVDSPASSFSKVSLDACDGAIEYDTGYSVRVEIDDNVEPYLDIEEDSGTLRIRLESGIWYDDVTCRAKITLPSLRSVAVADSARARVAGFGEATDLTFTVTDSSKMALSGLSAGTVAIQVSDSSVIEGRVTSDALKLDVSDSSAATLEGSAASVALKVGDSSSADLAGLKAGDVEVRLKDSSHARVWVTDRLSGSATDSSDLRYKGKPSGTSVSTSDSSSVSSY